MSAVNAVIEAKNMVKDKKNWPLINLGFILGGFVYDPKYTIKVVLVVLGVAVIFEAINKEGHKFDVGVADAKSTRKQAEKTS